jgi:3-oxoacyl-[acyl-carrier protein] reductase
MDLGIAGKKAIVCASSQGLGKGCAFSLAREGVAVTITGRTQSTLEQTAAAMRQATGAPVQFVVSDITTVEGRAAVLKACPDPDILVNNAGGPAPGDFHKWTRDDWLKAFDMNMLSAFEMIKATIDTMIARRFGRIVNITSTLVKAPHAQLGLSAGARAALTGFSAGLAREVAKHNVTVNNLLPGPFDTDRMKYLMGRQAQARGISEEQVRAQAAAANPSGRFGDPAEFGDACAFLCSAQAGYIAGQNLLLDGGAFPGIL